MSRHQHFRSTFPRSKDMVHMRILAAILKNMLQNWFMDIFSNISISITLKGVKRHQCAKFDGCSTNYTISPISR